MKTGVFKRMSYFAAALALAASGSIFVSGNETSAIKEGAVIGGSGDVVKVDMYLDASAGGSYTSVSEVGVTEPSNIDRVEKVLDGSGIASYDSNEDTKCLIGGNREGRVGQGVVTCKYWQDETVVLTVEATVHTYVNPSDDALDVTMVGGTTLKLADVVGNYFDDPTKITVKTDANEVECEEGEENCGVAFELTGTTVADAVITANNIATGATIYFYGPYSGEEEIGQLGVWVFEEPELKDLALVAYGEDTDKSVDFAIEDNGNLPPYTIVSSDENIVSVAEAAEQEDERYPAYTLTAEGVGEATITVTYDTYGNPTQTFKVTVDETVASGVYTELEATPIDASILGDVTISDFEATKRASEDVILAYYDVNLLVKDTNTGATVDRITEAGSARKIVLAYPSDLPELADGYTRVYYVIRDHNGTKEILPAYDNGDGENFYFYSDEFSTFALAYYDVETVVEETVTSGEATLTSATTATTNPNTLDNVANYVALTGLAAVAMVGAIVYLMKREA